MAKAEDDWSGLNSLAERLGLDESEHESFVTSAMKRLGHKPRTMWEDGESESGGGGKDFFGGGRSRDDKPRERSRERRTDDRTPWGYS